MKNITIIFIIILVVLLGWFVYQKSNQFKLPIGDTEKFISDINETNMDTSKREILITDGVKHSISLNEILSGGPAKDGIPSIDAPVFISTKEADEFLNDDSSGVGVEIDGIARFYPYQILVWHEIVNDKFGDKPVLITYCPLCALSVVYDPVVDGKYYEFGVSGKLWQSNLLMFNRTGDEKTESLWSQVLGEAVVGESTGAKLNIIPSSILKYVDWKKKYPDTEVLSKDTGAARSYGRDPYEGYYTDDTVGFGATFDDDRLHSKEFVLGVELNGKFKAYHIPALKEGETQDQFMGENIIIEKDKFGAVRMFVGVDKTELPYIAGFWFSWLVVHPDTELFK